MQTALLIKDKNVVFMTLPDLSGTFIEVYFADESFKPVGDPTRSLDERSEADYHKALRADADKAGQLVRKYCTNPELNPN